MTKRSDLKLRTSSITRHPWTKLAPHDLRELASEKLCAVSEQQVRYLALRFTEKHLLRYPRWRATPSSTSSGPHSRNSHTRPPGLQSNLLGAKGAACASFFIEHSPYLSIWFYSVQKIATLEINCQKQQAASNASSGVYIAASTLCRPAPCSSLGLQVRPPSLIRRFNREIGCMHIINVPKGFGYIPAKLKQIISIFPGSNC